MKYFYFFILLVGISDAAQPAPAPVYRNQPPVISPGSKQPAPGTSTPAPQAEERESQAYPTAQDPAKQVNVMGTSGMQSVNPNTAAIQTPRPLTTAAAPSEQVYKFYYVPGGQQQPGYPQTYAMQQPMDGQYGYQQTPGVVSSPGYFSNINWMDWLVGASSLGLVGLGTSMLYPNLLKFKSRAMRELSEINSDDAARMAKTVMKAIARFSEMNNARSD